MAQKEVSIWIKVKSAYTDAERKFAAFSKRIKRLGRDLAIGIGAITTATTAAVVGLVKLGDRGNQVLGVQRAFARITNDSTGALQKLRAATGGVISDFELMRQANMSIALGSASNVDQFSELATTAQALGRALGIDALYALESLNTGISRQSKLFLDNIGIVVDVEAANERYARSIGKTASQLSAAEKREAFRAAALEAARAKVAELGGEMDVQASAGQRFMTMLHNAYDKLSVLVATSPDVATFFDTMADGLDRMIEKLPPAVDLLRDMGLTVADLFTEGRSSARSRGREQANAALRPLSTPQQVLAIGGQHYGRALERQEAARIRAEDAQFMFDEISETRASKTRGVTVSFSEFKAAENHLEEMNAAFTEATAEVEALQAAMEEAARALTRAPGSAPAPGGGGLSLAELDRQLAPPSVGGFQPIEARFGAPGNLFRRDTFPTRGFGDGGFGLGSAGMGMYGRVEVDATNTTVGSLARSLALLGGPSVIIRDRSREDVEAAKGILAEAANTTVQAFESMATAAITNSADMEQAVLATMNSIVQAALRAAQASAAIDAANGVAGAAGLARNLPIIGSVLSAGFAIGGALLNRGNDRPARVRVDDFGSSARRVLQDSQPGPQNVIVRVESGRMDGATARAQVRRAERLDQIRRIPGG